MDVNATSGQLWPLKTGSTDSPALTAGQPVTFFFNDVPAVAPTGPLAYYMPYLLCTISLTLTQSGSTGVKIAWDRLYEILINSLEVSNCWHGTPVAPQFVKGNQLRVIEPLLSGWNRRAVRVHNDVPSGNGAYTFDFTFAVNLGSSRLGRLGRETSQLALLFRSGKFTINVAPASVLTALSPGATLSAMSAKCSAVLQPRQELVLGTPIETVLHTPVSGTGPAVLINGFGRDTQLTGVMNKGGVVYLSELTNLIPGGVFAGDAATRFSFPWRGQADHSHILGMLGAMLGQRPNDRPIHSVGTAAGTTDRPNDLADPPYEFNIVDSLAANCDLAPLLALEFVTPGDAIMLTDVQTADSDQQYNLTVSGGFTGGNHQILAEYAKAWQPTKVADWLAIVNGSGLAKQVMGRDVTAANLTRRVPRQKHTISQDQFDYLAWQAA